MNKIIILSLGLAALLASSAFANRDMCDMDKGDLKRSHVKHAHHRGGYLISAIMKLDLSDEQKKKIGDVMKQRMKNAPRVSDAFSDKGFDKELFVKIMKDKRENKIENKAQMIASIYDILTPPQKQELKKKLDEKAAMRKEYFKSCKN